jgi:hypothetical protein
VNEVAARQHGKNLFAHVCHVELHDGVAEDGRDRGWPRAVGASRADDVAQRHHHEGFFFGEQRAAIHWLAGIELVELFFELRPQLAQRLRPLALDEGVLRGVEAPHAQRRADGIDEQDV